MIAIHFQPDIDLMALIDQVRPPPGFAFSRLIAHSVQVSADLRGVRAVIEPYTSRTYAMRGDCSYDGILIRLIAVFWPDDGSRLPELAELL